MTWQERIVVDPEILVGKPAIRGTRPAVELIVDLLAQGWSGEEILKNYLGLTSEDVHACLRYASPVMPSENVYPLLLGSRAGICYHEIAGYGQFGYERNRTDRRY